MRLDAPKYALPGIRVALKLNHVYMSIIMDIWNFSMARDPFKVLFLCTGNSARSIIAEAIINREGQGRFVGYSAGSQPAAAPQPFALDLLRQLNHDVRGLRSKSWNEFAVRGAPRLDFVFTVCDNAAGETCPFWPGQPMTAHWGVPDPVTAEGSETERRIAFAETYRMLNQRISIFVNLPISSLDKLTLQKRLDDIGRSGSPAVREHT